MWVLHYPAPRQLLPVTQQIIASLGITSVEEWTKALEDKNLDDTSFEGLL
jgi:hypothetical protein